jgi:PhzF family phenazine biosynthesis protein
MKNYAVYQVDSFTKELFKGNPAGVVPNADGLDEAGMQQIARELNNSETAFLLAPDGPDCDGVIRYFTPRTEVPICGHATIAAMYVKALEAGLDAAVYRMRTGAGVLPFEIVRNGNDYRVIMTQGRIELESPLQGELRERVRDGLGLCEAELDERCPIQIASTGHSKVMIGIKRLAKLHRLNPRMSELAELSPVIGCNGYFVFTLDSDSPEVLTHGRMFAPAIGIDEDPVTGNAHGPLGAYLVHHGLVKATGDEFCFRGMQGEAMGRPGVMEVRVRLVGNRPVQVRIVGEAVIAFQTTLRL